MLIALLGQVSTHDSQPVHLDLSISAGITYPFTRSLTNRLFEKNGIITDRETITTPIFRALSGGFLTAPNSPDTWNRQAQAA
jgi:hypothetical protein